MSSLNELMRTNGTCRDYTTDPVSDAVLAQVLDAARWGPTGGNRQPVRFVAVRDRKKKETLRDLYLPIWAPYYKAAREGAVRVGAGNSILANADRFAHAMADIPVLLVVCARLGDVHPTDNKLGRLSIVGGASVYPAVQNLLLAAHEIGLGTALTTLLCEQEPAVKALLEIPEDISTAAMVTIGWPVKPFPKKLTRVPLSKMAFVDSYGAALPGADEVS
ncbi:MAG: nitroreductase family protein [Gammaproteobacteria bacterium]|nr:nitroreductase family protein [Gammaproteobacteria bacterium]